MPVPVVAEPISRVPTRETVAETLRAWIVDGTLAPEEILRDADLAQTFGISRTPVREALLQLEHEGLVESHPGRWTRVTPLDPAQLLRLYPVWSALEALVARLAATRAGRFLDYEVVEDAARAFAVAVDAVPSAPDATRTQAPRDADVRFHDALLTAAGNATLDSTLTPLRLTVRRFEASCPQEISYDGVLVDEHAGILAAMLAGDPDAAAAAMCAHVQHDHHRLLVGWGIPETQ